jgi:DNA-binding MarR family transcriptional regulator
MELTLFDSPPTCEVVATDPKRESYNKIRATVSSKREQVYGVIASCGPITQRQIAVRLDWDRNCVTGRVDELKKANLIETCGTQWDGETLRNVTLYVATMKADS